MRASIRRFNLSIVEHMSETAEQMRGRSRAIRRAFAMHKGAAGDHRESLVQRFLEDHLPNRFGVRQGFAISLDDWVSNQADVLIVDHENNAPLHAGESHELWPVESVFALIEVKTELSPRDIRDAVEKCRQFKQLNRRFVNTDGQKIKESLFVIWSFDGAAAATIKSNLVKVFHEVPAVERPDFVIDLNGLVATSGSYLEISKLGQTDSPHRRELETKHSGDLLNLLPDSLEALDAGVNSLLVWYLWFDSWLRNAGTRHCDPLAYIPPERHFGKKL